MQKKSHFRHATRFFYIRRKNDCMKRIKKICSCLNSLYDHDDINVKNLILSSGFEKLKYGIREKIVN